MSRNQSREHFVAAGSRMDKECTYCNYHKLSVSQQHKLIALPSWRSESEGIYGLKSNWYRRSPQNSRKISPPSSFSSLLPSFFVFAWFCCLLFCFWDKVLIYSPSWSGTHSITKVPLNVWWTFCLDLYAWPNLHQSWNNFFDLCSRFSESAV